MSESKSVHVSHMSNNIRSRARRFLHRIVVVKSTLGVFTGCIVRAEATHLHLRVFSTSRRCFVIIRIPYRFIVAIVLFRCRRCN
jgi:hypothetical protein